MIGFASRLANSTLAALGQSFATIEFTPVGKVITANETFCRTMGYGIDEIRGKHHSMFADPAYASSAEYRDFWAKLGRGEHDSGQCMRLAKGGREVWLQASYSPVLGRGGRAVKVVKLALDITEATIKAAADASKLQAMSRSQAIVEFDLQARLLEVNDNFLTTFGYARDEVIGRQHAMFVDPAYASSPEYEAFWGKLRNGEFLAGEFKRKGRGGRDIWLQGTYNPILDARGRVVKVVKFANDITDLMLGIETLGSGLTGLAAGNLKRRIDQPLTARLEKLRIDFNSALAAMDAAIREVSSAAVAMQSGAGEIAQASDDLSRRTEQQAASLEETATALQEITITVGKTATGAKHARTIVSQTEMEAEQSGHVARDAVTAMSGIEQSSRQIGQIIGMIDEIAFQTSLLALNAGVEAARAGDAGRGFAVVASEVRALAQRSADAAKEIKGLISTSAQQVGAGVKLVGEMGQALERIMAQVTDINGVVAEIASSASTQATKLAEVNNAVNEMDQVTQQNAAMAEQSTAAIHSMAQETSELAQLTARFQISDSPSAPVRAEAPPPGKVVRLPIGKPRVARMAPASRQGTIAGGASPAGRDEDWEEF